MYLFIVNPVAGRGRAVKTFEEVKELFQKEGAAYEVWETEHRKHAIELAKRAREEGYKSIIAVGGDGTVLEVASGLIGYACEFGIIPAGTGNDFVRSIGVSTDALTAAEIILKGKTRQVDIGIAGENYFMNVAGTGFDTEVIRFTEKYKGVLQGLGAYVAGLLTALFVYRCQKIRIKMDGEMIDRDIFLIAIANGATYGGGMKVAPQATPFDGFFDITIINRVSNFKIPFILGFFIKGQHDKIKEIEHFRCKSIAIDSGKASAINMDGEVIGQTPMEFTVGNHALTMYTEREE